MPPWIITKIKKSQHQFSTTNTSSTIAAEYVLSLGKSQRPLQILSPGFENNAKISVIMENLGDNFAESQLEKL